MKTIIRVAKTELKQLFYSPIAWFLLIVFFIQCGVVYLGALDGQARTQELGGMYMSQMNTLTQGIFLSSRGLFGSVMQNLYLYIPLLTMSLISRETGSGTIKLLYSSPVSVSEIVLGKYLAMVVYSLLLVAVIAVFVVSGMFHIQYAEKGMLLTGILGFFLLLCTYSAIGLFMSCLTTYQVVAAICTFVMIGILSYIGSLWQRVAFVRELTYFLSINGRTMKLLAGLVTSKDLIYFVVIVYLFLGLSIYKLKSGMESKPVLVKAGRYAALVISALLIGYVTSRPALTGYYDATFNKSRTLTPRVQKILADLGDEPLEVTSYANLLDQRAYLGGPESYNDNIARWEIYRRFKTNINLHNVSYYDSAFSNLYMMQGQGNKTLKDQAEQQAKAYSSKLKDYLTPEQIRHMIDLRPEENRFVMQLKWKNRTTWLRVFDDSQVWPGETEVAAALKRLQQAKLPVIGFITGNLERDINKMGDRDYKALTNLPSFRNSLVNQGFDVRLVTPETEDIPADIAALVIADPRLELPAATMARLQQYIDKGGNLLIAGEPGRQQLLNPLLSRLGVQLMNGTLLQENKEEGPDVMNTKLQPVTAGFYKPVAKALADSTPVSMAGAAAITYQQGGAFTIQPLLVTDSTKSWNRIKPVDPEMMISGSASAGMGSSGMPSPAPAAAPAAKAGSMGAPGSMGKAASAGKVASAPMGASVPGNPGSADRSRAGVVAFSPQDGDVKGPLTTAISLTRRINGKEQRIVVTGDADFLGTKELKRYGRSNFVFGTSLFSWLSYGDFPIDASRPDARDKRVTVTMDQVERLRVIYIWVIPAVLLAFAAVLLIRRKRK